MVFIAKPVARAAEVQPADAPAPVKRGRGAVSTFNMEQAQRIVAELSKGVPLAWICDEEGMPAVRTVGDWRAAEPQFAADFARARKLGYEAIAAQCIRIADQPNETVTDDGRIVTTVKNDAARDRLRVETRLKLLAKWYPTRYGDKSTVDVNAKLSLEALVLASLPKPSPGVAQLAGPDVIEGKIVGRSGE